MAELWSLSLGQMREGLLKKEFKVFELTRSCLDRIAYTEPKVKSCLCILEEKALERALELDKNGPDPNKLLWGLPLSLKDVFCFKGAPTTAGSKMLASYSPVFEATVTERLKNAGAVILSKTNLDEFAMGSSTEFSAFGPSRNPWNLERVPGGSSGGAAASVAARQTPGAFGTDTGGSIRQPAALCGIVGLKPTYGRVSRYGIVAYGSSLDQAGPLARNVSDCGRLLAAVAGPDERDSTVSVHPVDDYINLKKPEAKKLCLGLPKEFWDASFSSEISPALESAKKELLAAGVTLKEISMPNLRFAVATYYILAAAEASTNLARYDGVRYGHRYSGESNLFELYNWSRSQGLGSEAKRRILLGTFVLSSGYYEAYFRKAAQVRRLILEDFKKALLACDFILSPVSTIPPWPFGSFDCDPLTLYQMDMMTLPLNLAGWPGLSLPVGLGSDGLPVGLQLFGPPFGEASLLSVGLLLEEIFPKLSLPEL